MKKLLATMSLALLMNTHAFADGHMGGFHGPEHHEFHGAEHHEFHGGGYHGYRGGFGYYPYYYGGYYYDPFGSLVVPALIGGAIGYELAQPNQTIIMQPPPVIVQTQSGSADNAPPGYHTEAIMDAKCNCYRNVLVKN